ncbi:MAG: hypothetical protein JXR68_07025 [Bacteroidales bacterium]|nr:hypothetical protein [Bacteroidales bacterium]
MRKIIFLFIISIIVISCNEEVDNNTNKPDTSNTPIIPGLVKVRNKVFSVPSPIQASILVKDLNIPFYKDFLNSPDNYVKYLTTFKQSVNIGVYGANLGNLFIYDQLSESAHYFTVIKKLAEQVGVLNSLNHSIFDRIENNSNNKDSLIFLMSDIFKDIDSYLLENDQEQIGVLIIAGGWIEGLYLLTKISAVSDNPEVNLRIGEQKSPLNNIIDLLQPYYNSGNTDLDYLIEKLVDLSIVFEGVEDVYTYEAPETDPQNKITIINSVTTYNISADDLMLISEKIESLRTWIIE